MPIATVDDDGCWWSVRWTFWVRLWLALDVEFPISKWQLEDNDKKLSAVYLYLNYQGYGNRTRLGHIHNHTQNAEGDVTRDVGLLRFYIASQFCV